MHLSVCAQLPFFIEAVVLRKHKRTLAACVQCLTYTGNPLLS